MSKYAAKLLLKIAGQIVLPPERNKEQHAIYKAFDTPSHNCSTLYSRLETMMLFMLYPVIRRPYFFLRREGTFLPAAKIKGRLIAGYFCCCFPSLSQKYSVPPKQLVLNFPRLEKDFFTSCKISLPFTKIFVLRHKHGDVRMDNKESFFFSFPASTMLPRCHLASFLKVKFRCFELSG